MVLNPDQYRLDESEHQAIFERKIEPDIFTGAKPSNQPVVVIFGGQPGAGKSAAIDAAVKELGVHGGCVQIIGDDLRDYHPRYADLMEADDKTAAFYTDRDTGRWVEKAIAEAKAQRVNIVIEGTMRNGEVVAATMQNLREAGYQIDARALAVNPRLSEQEIRHIEGLRQQAKVSLAAELFRQESPETAAQEQGACAVHRGGHTPDADMGHER